MYDCGRKSPTSVESVLHEFACSSMLHESCVRLAVSVTKAPFICLMSEVQSVGWLSNAGEIQSPECCISLQTQIFLTIATPTDTARHTKKKTDITNVLGTCR